MHSFSQDQQHVRNNTWFGNVSVGDASPSAVSLGNGSTWRLARWSSWTPWLLVPWERNPWNCMELEQETESIFVLGFSRRLIHLIHFVPWYIQEIRSSLSLFSSVEVWNVVKLENYAHFPYFSPIFWKFWRIVSNQKLYPQIYLFFLNSHWNWMCLEFLKFQSKKIPGLHRAVRVDLPSGVQADWNVQNIGAQEQLEFWSMVYH